MFSSRFNSKNASKVKLFAIYGDFFLHQDCKNGHRSQFLDKQGHDSNNFKWTRELNTAQKYIFTYTSMI
jgi:hypothetical protein